MSSVTEISDKAVEFLELYIENKEIENKESLEEKNKY